MNRGFFPPRGAVGQPSLSQLRTLRLEQGMWSSSRTRRINWSWVRWAGAVMGLPCKNLLSYWLSW
jgi:hypothetical protein